ncbi:MAG: hypothetical protein ACYC91_17050 [Solirubrobacteraceae bacterium]
MKRVSERFRGAYGAGPLHLLALLASLLIAGIAVAGWFDNTGSILRQILIWFIGAIIGHDLVLLPLYSMLDRIAFGALPDRRPDAPRQRSPGWVYVRVPAGLCGLIFLVFFAEILRLGNDTFHTASGLSQNVYLSRFLITCAGLFTLSALAYAFSLRRSRGSVPAPRAVQTDDEPAG